MENLGFGLTLTVLGMGIVFGLLAFLWGFLVLLGKLDKQPADEQAAAEATAPVAAAFEVVSGDKHGLSDDALAAISVAILSHTIVRRRQGAPAMRSSAPGSQLYASRWLAAGRTRQTRGWIPPKR